MSSKIDITSTALEKGIDIAKNFVDKLIMPAVEETGLLVKDNITEFRFKRQLKMLQKAKYYCDKNNINLKTVSLKLLCPLLDYSGLEEDDFLLDKWAVLLSNMVDSEQNLENHVFPYILSQLSSDEFKVLENLYDKKQDEILKIQEELATFKNVELPIKVKLEKEIAELTEQRESVNRDKENNFQQKSFDLFSKRYDLEKELEIFIKNEASILSRLKRPITLPDIIFENFELSNLIRLGIIKEEKDFYANSQTLEIPNSRDENYFKVDLDVNVESYAQNIFTGLGELFIYACKEKTKINK